MLSYVCYVCGGDSWTSGQDIGNQRTICKSCMEAAVGRKVWDYEVLANTVRYSRICRVTGERYSVEVPTVAHRAWLDGKLIQDAFPELNADQREFLISALTPAEWHQMLGEEE